MKASSPILSVAPRLFLPALLALLVPAVTQAQVGLTSGNSSVTINTNGAATGAVNWTIDGVNILDSTASGLQSFYFSTGGGAAQNLAAITGSPVVNNVSGQETKVTYGNASFSIAVDFLLSGGAAGSGVSGLQESISIQNKTASTLALRFYQFSDFSGIASAQVALGVNAAKTRFNDGTVFSPTITVDQVDNTLSPGAPLGQLNITLAQLLTGPGAFTPSGLASGGALGPVAGNTYVTSSDLVIAGNGSMVINDGNTASVVPAPEPAVWSLLSLGLIVFGSARYFRRSSKVALAPVAAQSSSRSTE